MRITDYESTKSLTDVGIVLTKDEAEELYITLHKMLDRPELRQAYLTEYRGCGIERELSVTIDREAKLFQMTA